MITDVAITAEHLADLARREVLRHAPRTPGRRAAASLWTALITTTSVDSAKRALPGFTSRETERAALALLHRLALTAREGNER